MPKLPTSIVEEMQWSNPALRLYAAGTSGAVLCLEDYAPETIKQCYLPNMNAGLWAGTIAMTEPHSGTDLGLMRTKASAQEGGSYTLTGTKIFITGCDQDLTDNIVHLVLTLELRGGFKCAATNSLENVQYKGDKPDRCGIFYLARKLLTTQQSAVPVPYFGMQPRKRVSASGKPMGIDKPGDIQQSNHISHQKSLAGQAPLQHDVNSFKLERRLSDLLVGNAIPRIIHPEIELDLFAWIRLTPNCPGIIKQPRKRRRFFSGKAWRKEVAHRNASNIQVKIIFYFQRRHNL